MIQESPALKDWKEKVNLGKTERLRLRAGTRNAYDIRREGEMKTVRHIGGWLSERGGNALDTRIRCTKARTPITKMAKAWAIGSYRGRGTNSRMLISVRLQVAKAIVIPILATFSRTRRWTKGDIASVQWVANYAVRRCMGMDKLNLHRLHISDKM